jgi:hypothetical protein
MFINENRQEPNLFQQPMIWGLAAAQEKPGLAIMTLTYNIIISHRSGLSSDHKQINFTSSVT